ncbi:MAG: DedA family protein [Planctomycetes bacterium]|nr:DedA family protein [Planctomycetota bacterium]
MTNPLKKLYNWVLSWANSPWGAWALFVLAVAESSFFPIPPDILLIALGLSIPTKSFRYALICSVGSVLGGVIGYYIGYGLYETVGSYVVNLYNLQEAFDKISCMYQDNAFMAVAIAGFTPIPYKVFTIAAGVCRINLWIFILASILSRSARFFIVATIIRFGGAPAKRFIDRYFNLLTIIFVVLLVGGFLLIKLWMK